jgi:rsbT co-antagonist protein RsbR
MNSGAVDALASLLQQQRPKVLEQWLLSQNASQARRTDLVNDAELRTQCAKFLEVFQRAVSASGAIQEVTSPAWDDTRRYLEELSTTRARLGFTPTETAMFVFSLKPPLFAALRTASAKSPQEFADELVRADVILDQLGLYTTEVFIRSREELIGRQQGELMELSTPVVTLWKNILALPLVGTLDSARAQVVMESLLQKIVETESEIAIIDITGVPTVDTLVAQHLLKTVAATRLMGADCIISGIRPQIAQTIVHLGVDLGDVTTKATLADAFAVALERTRTSLDERRVGS